MKEGRADQRRGTVVRVGDLVRYCSDLGWREALELPAAMPEARPESPAAAAPSLAALAHRVAGCQECALAARRKLSVFGEGHPEADVLFIGEAPGAEEDRSGRPFVGQAGQLLDGMIAALGLDRAAVYITNVVKCRPPRNRDPEEAEMGACAAILDRQVELIAPKVIVAMGRIAARRLTGSAGSMTSLRGSWASYRGIPLLAIFHPAYLLRQPAEKRATWEDLKALRRKLVELGVLD